MSKKVLCKPVKVQKKFRYKYTKLVKFTLKTSKNVLRCIVKFIKNNRKLFYKTAIILVCFINVYANIDIASASESYEKTIIQPEKSIISGDIDSYQKTSKFINPYLNYQINSNKDSKNTISHEKLSYLEKPVITDTQSRLEIEKAKQEELEKQQIEEYQRYLALNQAYENTSRDVVTRDESASRSIEENLGVNTYYYGYCTWYVANRRSIPNQWGNAGQWFNSAQASGYPTGYEPAPGAIIVTSESGWGHVGYVESVSDQSITISEMNYAGWGIVNTREISKNNPVITGYIY